MSEYRPPEILFLDRMETPIGTILVVADGGGRMRALDWLDCAERMERLLRLHYGPVGAGFLVDERPMPQAMREALEAYFNGDLAAPGRILVRTGGTAFQRDVWAALREIPAGTTITYGELAGRVGRPKAIRAVGLANGANPLSVVVPCHRVIGKGSSLSGYAGGLERKRWLLAHEGVALSGTRRRQTRSFRNPAASL